MLLYKMQITTSLEYCSQYYGTDYSNYLSDATYVNFIKLNYLHRKYVKTCT